MGEVTGKLRRGPREVGAGGNGELQRHSASSAWSWLHLCVSESWLWVIPFGLHLNRNRTLRPELYVTRDSMLEQHCRRLIIVVVDHL